MWTFTFFAPFWKAWEAIMEKANAVWIYGRIVIYALIITSGLLASRKNRIKYIIAYPLVCLATYFDFNRLHLYPKEVWTEMQLFIRQPLKSRFLIPNFLRK
jgi:hypothetical protein